jgi:hypothetical protein
MRHGASKAGGASTPITRLAHERGASVTKFRDEIPAAEAPRDEIRDEIPAAHFRGFFSVALDHR